MSEPSFLDWYPRGRLSFLSSKQSKDLKIRIDFAESISSALLIFINVKYDLQATLDAWSFSEKNGDLPSFRLPSAFHISPGPQDFSSLQLSEASRSCLALTDYVCRFSGEFFSQLVQHTIFRKALEDNPELVKLSVPPVLIFDRAIYAIDVGVERLVIESPFPPVQFYPDFGFEGHLEEMVFFNSTGATSAVINRDGNPEVFPVVETLPFFSKFNEANKKSIHEFFKENILSLTRLLETQSLIINRLSEYFMNDFESSVNLLKNREALWTVSVDEIDA